LVRLSEAARQARTARSAGEMVVQIDPQQVRAWRRRMDDAVGAHG
jgi:hypothetical protein